MRIRAPLTALFVLVLGAGCLDAAEERARFDEAVGRANAENLSVEVSEGLAAVKRLERDSLSLWAGAPGVAFALHFPPTAPDTFNIAIENVLPDASLISAAGPGPTAEPSDTGIPTEKRWSLRPPAGGGTVQLRLEAPGASAAGRFRFAVFADVQRAIDRVQDIFERMNQDPTLRFAIMSGDLTDRGSTGELTRFQREMKSLHVPVYATLGNHELGTGPDLFHRYFGRGNFRFTFQQVQVTLLDSASATIAPTAYRWLGHWLDEGRALTHIVAMHIPPIDPVGTRNGSFASRAEASKLLALLAEGGVDLTVYGHVHSYYAFSNAGIPAFITGGGGAIPERFDGIGRHYLAIEVDPVTRIIETTLVRVD